MATKVYCAQNDCAFWKENGRCTAASIHLSSNSVVTVWDGRQQFNKCLDYQKSEKAKEFEKKFAGLLEAMKNATVRPLPTEVTIDEDWTGRR